MDESFEIEEDRPLEASARTPADPASESNLLPPRLVARLSLYRRMLLGQAEKGRREIYSHDLAALVGTTAAQVRRDLMTIGVTGSPARGYPLAGLVLQIGHHLDAPAAQSAALVGVGSLGRAILSYFSARKPRLAIVAAFDKDPEKVGHIVHGCRCYLIEELDEVVRREGISVGIISVPASTAEEVSRLLIASGITGILNFAPVPLPSSAGVFVEQIDFTSAMERVAYFARRLAPGEEARP